MRRIKNIVVTCLIDSGKASMFSLCSITLIIARVFSEGAATIQANGFLKRHDLKD